MSSHSFHILFTIAFTVNLDTPSNLQAKKIAEASSSMYCIEIKWKEQQSGLCFVKYEVSMRDASNVTKFTKVDYNAGNMTKCGIPVKINITEVQLIMSFKTSKKSSTAKVRELQHTHNLHTTYIQQRGNLK